MQCEAYTLISCTIRYVSDMLHAASPHVKIFFSSISPLHFPRPPRCSDLLQLIHSRSHLPLAFPTDLGGPSPIGSNLPGQMADIIDLHKLQEDILATCIAGKPLIDETSIASMRIPFKFKEDTSSLSLHIRCVHVYVHNDPQHQLVHCELQ